MALLPRATSTPSTCYSLSGTKAPFDALNYIPCNTTATSLGLNSACCASTDLCLTNGLCKYNAPSSAPDFNEYWRVGCTDPTYQDPSCPQQCKNVPGGGGETHLIFQCPGDGKWCCAKGNLTEYRNRGSVNTTCCDTEGLAFDGAEAVVYTTAQVKLDVKTSMAETKTVSVSKTGSAETTSTTTSVSTSVVPTSSALPQEKEKSNSNLATGVGLGVGIPGAVAVILALLFLILRNRRQKRNQNHSHLPATNPPSSMYPPHELKTPSSTITTTTPNNSNPLFFWRRKNSTAQTTAEVTAEDMRTTNPHAFYTEAHGREVAAEMESWKAPVELSTPEQQHGKQLGVTAIEADSIPVEGGRRNGELNNWREFR